MAKLILGFVLFRVRNLSLYRVHILIKGAFIQAILVSLSSWTMQQPQDSPGSKISAYPFNPLKVSVPFTGLQK